MRSHKDTEKHTAEKGINPTRIDPSDGFFNLPPSHRLERDTSFRKTVTLLLQRRSKRGLPSGGRARVYIKSIECGIGVRDARRPHATWATSCSL